MQTSVPENFFIRVVKKIRGWEMGVRMIMGADVDADEGTRPIHVGFQGHSRNEDPVRGVRW